MDLIALAAAKNYANKVAAGFKSVEINGMNLTFTLLDNTKATVAIPAPANGKDGVSIQNLSIDNDGSLLCHMSDGSTIDAGKVPMTEVELTDYYTKEETDVLLENSGLKTFIWDGLSSEENADNLTFFEEFYADLVASEGKTRLLVTTPNVVSPTYMNAEVGVDKSGTDAYLTISTYPSWWSSVEGDSEEYNLYTSTAYVNIENGKCVEVSELSDYEAEFHFLSTTRQYDSGNYYTPISDGSPVSKGYMIEALREGKYSISPDQLEEEFQDLITEPIITIDDEDPTEIEFVRYEGETDGEYDFVYEDNWWGDGYRSTNGAYDNSYALGKFILNNPGDKTVRVSIDYDLTCATGDTAVFSELDTELTADSWNDYTNAYKVITGESYIYGSIAYDLTPGEHFITFKYMVGWKDEGEGQGDSLMVSFGWTNGAVQEHYIATQQYVKDYVAANGGGSGEGVDLSNYYTKNEVGNLIETSLSTMDLKTYTPISTNVDMGTLPSGVYMNTSGNWLDVKIAKAGKTTLSVKPGGYVFWSNALLDVTESAYSFIWTINWDGTSTGVFDCARIQPSSDNTSHVFATGISLDLSKIVTQQYVDDNIANINIGNYYTAAQTNESIQQMADNMLEMSGELTDLTTVDKSNFAAAINEVNAKTNVPRIYDMWTSLGVTGSSTTRYTDLEENIKNILNGNIDRVCYLNIRSSNSNDIWFVPVLFTSASGMNLAKKFNGILMYGAGGLLAKKQMTITIQTSNGQFTSVRVEGAGYDAVTTSSYLTSNYYKKTEVDSLIPTVSVHDGEGMIGWYGTAVAGDNLTEAYGVTPDMVRAVRAGDKIS